MDDIYPLPPRPKSTGPAVARFRAYLGHSPFAYKGHEFHVGLQVARGMEELRARRLTMAEGLEVWVECSLMPAPTPDETLDRLVAMAAEEMRRG